MNKRHLIVLLAALLAWPGLAAAAATAANRLDMLAIWDPIMAPKTSVETICRETDRLLAQCGHGDATHRIGFAFVYPIGRPELLRRAAQVAREKGIVLGPILALQTHHRADLERTLAGDLRNFQWRSDGENWVPAKQPKAPEPADRPMNALCSSRYCKPVRDNAEARARQAAKELLAVCREFPGIIVVVNPVIEESLHGWEKKTGESGSASPAEFYTDCSPFAVMEFRDWLRHTGRYDATGGRYAGEGAPPEITGPPIMINGRWRSMFYDDPDPGRANGTGLSFNAVFGTHYQSWTLRYWDPDNFPAPLSDRANLMPQTGTGFTEGGFDVPRVRDNAAPFWKAWNWVYQDQKGYPPGPIERPAYGFRQWQVRNYVNDLCGWLLEEGVPRELIYAHQVPGEALGESHTAVMQARGLAQTVWSGWVPACGTVGITRFGPIDPKLMTRYAGNWGIFEWHPAPGAKPDQQRLYDAARRDLKAYADNGCRILFPGWWSADGKHFPTFPLNNSRFTDAIRDYLSPPSTTPTPADADKTRR